MTVGRSAGEKRCDDCRDVYVGPAYVTYAVADCPIRLTMEHLPGCSENLCPDCGHKRGIPPDRKDDER